MSISYVGAAVGTTTATVPTHTAGDLLLAFAHRDGNTTAPSLPAGWTGIGSGGANLNSSRLAYKVAASSGETSGTWTNATGLLILVYRGTHATTPIGGFTAGGASSLSVAYPALTMTNTSGSSWVVGVFGHRSIDINLTSAPTGMTNRTSQQDATASISAFDTNGGVSSWSLQTVTHSGTSAGWRSWTVELLAGASGATGSGSLVESGADALAGAGAVLVQGAGALSETGVDTLAGSGSLGGGISGAGALVESGADLMAATGKVLVSGAGAIVESGADVLAGTGAVRVSGAAALQEVGPDILFGSGATPAAINGSAALVESGADALAAAGKVRISGSCALVEVGADVLVGLSATLLPPVSVTGTHALAASIIAGHAAAASVAASHRLAASITATVRPIP